MYHAPLVHTLRKQQRILEELISRFAERKNLNETDCLLYDAATQKVEQNLKRLRKSLSPFQKIKQKEEKS